LADSLRSSARTVFLPSEISAIALLPEVNPIASLMRAKGIFERRSTVGHPYSVQGHQVFEVDSTRETLDIAEAQLHSK
jgi:hypothetical protein